jgi:crotonobetainyl-CoA:carnitine CoA-transferase CaiB-like acyl-CoA transferase
MTGHSLLRSIVGERCDRVDFVGSGGLDSDDWQPTASRPLSGIKVLDLTRVLAGPVATRFLAGFGARVLRIDPPDWDEPGVIPEVTLGKNCARLDLRQAADRARFDTLLADCDLIVHGYRPGALDRLGYGLDRRRALRPGLIDISLCAYGWSGPWSERRGFDSLVQMSCGIADRGMGWRQTDRPVPLPVQALDHGTGYLLAAAAIDAIRRRLTDRSGSAVRLSLARTAELLKQAPNEKKQIPLFPETEADWASAIEQSDWGPARRLLPPAMIEGAPMVWNNPARALGSAPLDWPN